jgi:uncharacterized membrane protein YbhN (UPF0104 family)
VSADRIDVARGRHLATRVAPALVSAALLALLVWALGGPSVARMIATVDLGWFGVTVVLLMTFTVLAALRWRATAEPLGIRLSPTEAVREYFLSQLVNSALPGGIVGDAGRAARSRHQAGLAPAAGAVVVERTIGQLALLATLGAGFAVTFALPGGLQWPPAVAVAVASLLSGFWMLALLLALGVRHVRPPTGSRRARVVDGLRRCAADPAVVRSQAALSAGTTFCILAAFACSAAAIGAPLSVAAVVAVVPLVLMAMLLPISVGGWGVREGAAVTLLPIAGMSGAEAFASSAVFGLAALVSALPGFVPIWARRRTPRPKSVQGSKSTRMQHPPPTAGPEEIS